MRTLKTINSFIIVFLLSTLFSCAPKNDGQSTKQVAINEKATEILPSWNDSKNKTDIINYVKAVTDKNSKSFIPVVDRIAVFDNDGTIWSEQPAYFQLFFAMDRIKELAPQHPEWKDQPALKAVLDNDMKALGAAGMKGVMQVIMVSHTGMTSEEYISIVEDWIKTAKHPTKAQAYNTLVYKPMMELLAYLRANDFKTYIVSGGGVEFMRPIISELYGIPNEQIIGSSVKTEYDYNNGNPVVNRLPELDFLDDGGGKTVNISKIIGKKPVFCAGNSDGDLAMMQWTASNTYKNFMLYVHHTDAEREWAYDRKATFGKFDKALDQATNDNWNIVDMKNDWGTIFID